MDLRWQLIASLLRRGSQSINLGQWLRDARRRTQKFATFFLGSNCGATIRIYSGSAKAPPLVDKFRRTEKCC